jgi:glutaredoxin-like protein
MPDPIIGEKDREMLREMLGERMVSEVRMVMFTQRSSELILPEHLVCATCQQAQQLYEEFADLSDRLTLGVHDFQTEAELAREYGVDKIPAVAIVGEKDYGVRYFGTPGGYEFAAFLEDVIDVSRGTTDLPDSIKERLGTLEKDLHLEVFVNPTCPYCPRAVRMAHQMAIESDRVRADMIETAEFPHLVQKYNILGVPQTLVNGNSEAIQGAIPEPLLLFYALHLSEQMTDEEKKKWELIQEQLRKAQEQAQQVALEEHEHHHHHEGGEENESS